MRHPLGVFHSFLSKKVGTDRVDSVKLVRSLKAGLLRGIYIREKENIDDRSVVRIRKTIQKQLSGYKARVKHMLHCNGVLLPERFEKPGSHWSKAFIKWLKEDVRLLSSTRNSLDLLIRQVETIRMTLLEATKMMRLLSQTERYKRKFDLLMTVPGIGVAVSMCIKVAHGEIGVLMRKGQDDLFTLVNAVIAQMKADGTLRQLHEKYGLVYGFE